MPSPVRCQFPCLVHLFLLSKTRGCCIARGFTGGWAGRLQLVVPRRCSQAACLAPRCGLTAQRYCFVGSFPSSATDEHFSTRPNVLPIRCSIQCFLADRSPDSFPSSATDEYCSLPGPNVLPTRCSIRRGLAGSSPRYVVPEHCCPLARWTPHIRCMERPDRRRMPKQSKVFSWQSPR
jgi:hypothetical protein